MSNRTYIAIDLKSFYASVECMDRNLDPMTTNLVVAAVLHFFPFNPVRKYTAAPIHLQRLQ